MSEAILGQLPVLLEKGEPMYPYCTAIIMAGGKGTRMGGEVSKQFLCINGKEILAHTVDLFEKCQMIQEIILVSGKTDMEKTKELVKQYGWTKVSAVTEGGKERQDSVSNGLLQVSMQTEIVLVQDAVRPFVTEDMIQRSMEGAIKYGACIVGMPVKDTIKICSLCGMVMETPDRCSLWQAQTPQTFRKDILMQAYAKAKEAGFSGTDDASVVEFSGNPVKIVEGSYRNIKITTAEDIYIAEALEKGGKK